MPTETRSEDAQHWIEPLSQLDVLLESERTMYGEATARRGRARAVKAATRENILVELKGVELLE